MDRFQFILKRKEAYFPGLFKPAPLQSELDALKESADLSGFEPGVAYKEEGGPVLLNMASTPNFLSMPLDFQGFCVYSLVTFGILVPGNPQVGVVSYKGDSSY